MPKQKKIAYRKCHQCRKDRQKCLPEKRNWPGHKCDRCQHYNYECSAMRTKGEESSIPSSARASDSPGIPSTTGSASPPIQRSEIRCLQDLGDLQEVSMILDNLALPWYSDPYSQMDEFLVEALSDAVQETMVWARRHEVDGRYRDAEYLIRRANSGFYGKESLEHMWSHLSAEVLPTMVAMYGKLGDYTAEEKCQEKLVEMVFYAKSQRQVNEEQNQAVVALSRSLSNFHRRVLDLVPNFGESDLLITYRAAVLDIVLLNEVLLKQGLITSKTHRKHHCASLHIAAKQNATNLARQLIEMGADVNSEDQIFRTPLHTAALYAGSEMIELLLDNQAKVEAVDCYRNTPLHAAVRGKHPQETVTSLVNAKAPINAMARYVDASSYGATALNLAIEGDLPAIASLLLEQGAEAKVEASARGKAPLFAATECGRTWAVDLLLDHGANLLAPNLSGDNVLDVAVMMGQESIVQILLDRGEKAIPAFYEKNKVAGIQILHSALDHGNVSVVKMLLKAGVDRHVRDDYDNTALHQVIREGGKPQERIVQLLLEHDAVGMQRVNMYGNTALHLAVRHSRRNMLVILLQHEPGELPALCQMRNHDGQTPLDIARAMAKDKEDPSVEISVLYLLENALQLVSAAGLHRGIGEETWNSDLV